MVPAYLSYIVTEGFLFVFTLNIWLKLGTSLGSEAETRELNYIIYAYLAALATDILWALAENNTIAPGNGVLAVVNGAYLCAFTSVCFFWFRFAMVRLKLHFSMPHALLMAPYAVTIALIVTSAFTGWFFYIDGDGTYIHGKLYALYLIIGCYFYPVLSSLRSASELMRTRLTAKRRECLVCAAYILPPCIGQALKPVLPTVPIMHLCMFLILQVLFLTLQENQIYNDALTGLNNRRRLNYYLEEQLLIVSEKRPIHIFMMDMNNFKSINESFGHVEGDRALIVVGSALKRAAAEFNAFVARYGGDEFCMVCIGGKCDRDTVIARIGEILHRTQLELAEDSVKKYTLSMCVGYAACSTPRSGLNQVIRMADEKLHEAKQIYRSGNHQGSND